VFCVDKITN
jgi:hypothetical protein